MASGLPIIAADTPVAGNCVAMPRFISAALGYRPGRKLQQLIGDGRCVEQLRESGYVRVESMTWQSHVRGCSSFTVHGAEGREQSYEKTSRGKPAFPTPS